MIQYDRVMKEYTQTWPTKLHHLITSQDNNGAVLFPNKLSSDQAKIHAFIKLLQIYMYVMQPCFNAFYDP